MIVRNYLKVAHSATIKKCVCRACPSQEFDPDRKNKHDLVFITLIRLLCFGWCGFLALYVEEYFYFYFIYLFIIYNEGALSAVTTDSSVDSNA